MTNMKMIYLCSQVNFRKWIVNPRIYTIAAIIVAFLTYHEYGLSQLAAENGEPLTPWIFSQLFTPPVMQVFASLTVLLFCDAPFADRHTPFLIIRAGRQNWLIGQLIYIVVASFIYTAFILVVSILALIPNVRFSMDWGIIIKSLAVNPQIAPNTVTVFMNEEIIKMFTPLEATFISFGLFWLVTVFIGIILFYFNIVIGKMSGLIVTGIFIFISYFVVYLGPITIGEKIYYFSPLNWMSISYINWSDSGSVPSPPYVLLFLFISILIMITGSVVSFLKKDLNLHEWGS